MNFDTLMILMAIMMHVGSYIDAHAHICCGFQIESFFVPTHYVLYGGWLGIFALLAWRINGQIRARKPVKEWLPRGYDISAVGALLFGIGGGFDFLWHSAFGFEQDLEALWSPSHVLIFVASALIFAGMLKYTFYRRKQFLRQHSPTFRSDFPLILCSTFILHIITFPTWYFDPLTADYASGGALMASRDAYKLIDFGGASAEIAGVMGVVVITAILVACILVPLYHWRLPSGSLTIMMGYVWILRTLTTETLIFLPAVLGAALVGELIYAGIRRGGEASLSRPIGYRVLAFSIPFMLFTIYFLTIALMPRGIIWSLNLWAGSIVIAGIIGLLQSFAIIPFTIAEDRDERVVEEELERVSSSDTPVLMK